MKINLEIKDELITDMLITAFEGGSNYWATLCDVKRKYFVKGDSLAENVARSFIADKEYKLDVYDVESDEDEPDLLGSVTYASIESALGIMAKDYPKTYASIMSDNMDGDDADVWFQIAAMGEVVFG